MAVERPSSGFGATLRGAREQRGISLRQIANTTRISLGALEALERNDISRLPGGIFSRSFVRSYAIEVGLDPDKTVQEFVAQFPNDSVTAGHPTSDQSEDNVGLESERRLAGTVIWLFLVSVPIAAAVMYYATTGSRSPAEPAPSVVATPAPPPKPPATAEEVPVVKATEPAAASATPEAASRPTPTGSTTSVAGSASRSTSAPSTSGVAPAAAPTAAESDVAGDRLTISLTATRPCWVSATVDGQKAIERLLQAGDQKTVDVRREMVLTVGDAAALAVTFNGADARPLGKAGEVVTARFNLRNFRNYLQVR